MPFTQWCRSGHLSRQKFVEITATNPARLLNIPHKERADKVFLRGQLMAEKGEFIGKKGEGKRQHANNHI